MKQLINLNKTESNWSWSDIFRNLNGKNKTSGSIGTNFDISESKRSWSSETIADNEVHCTLYTRHTSFHAWQLQAQGQLNVCMQKWLLILFVYANYSWLVTFISCKNFRKGTFKHVTRIKYLLHSFWVKIIFIDNKTVRQG